MLKRKKAIKVAIAFIVVLTVANVNNVLGGASLESKNRVNFKKTVQTKDENEKDKNDVTSAFNNEPKIESQKMLSVLNYNKETNAKKHIVLKTYEGSGQACHPKVIYFDNKWNGWKYWMVFTPYANSDELTENPSIVVSNDGISWKDPSGKVQSIIQSTGVRGLHYSDPHLVYNNKTNQLELWYRYTAKGKLDVIYRCISDDGVKWSKPQQVIASAEKSLILSPAIIYEENKYKMWYIGFVKHQLVCEYVESDDGIKWTSPAKVNVDISSPYVPWHLDVVRTEKGYEMLLCSYRNDDPKANNKVLMWASSNDGFTFNNFTTILKPSGENKDWDSQQIYRSTFVKVDGIYKIYYSAMDKNEKWHIGLTEGKDLLNLHGYK